MRFRALALASIPLVVAAASSAGPLAPKKPSELVTLLPSDTCDNGDGFLYGNVANRDGGFSALAFPKNSVLVLTHWSFSFTGGTDGLATLGELSLDGSPIPLAVAPFVFQSNGFGAAEAPIQVVVGPGTLLCGRQINGLSTIAPFSGLLHGYFAKDK